MRRSLTWWCASHAARAASFGASASEERVCIDRNRITGGGITAGVDFGIAIAALWAGEPMGRVIELMMEYAPSPPFGCGRPEIASPETLASVRSMLEAEFQA